MLYGTRGPPPATDTTMKGVVVPTNGAVPLNVLEEEVDRYIAGKQA